MEEDATSSKKKQENCILQSQLTTNHPSKKVKSARTEEVVVVRLFNERGVQIPVQIEREILLSMFDFFKNLVENLGDGETEIALEEDDIYKAASFLLEIADFCSKRNKGVNVPPTVAWDEAKAILSTKWLAEDFVEAYSSVAAKHVEVVLKKVPVDVSAIEISGAVEWSSTAKTATLVSSPINGIYDKTDELSCDLPIYKRRGLTKKGRQFIMMYHHPTTAWYIKWVEHKDNLTCCAHIKCDDTCVIHQPHLVRGSWKVGGRDAPGAEVKHIDQPGMKASLPPSPDVLLFWEIIRTGFQYVGLRKGPIHTMEDLIEELSKRRDLCVKEEMMKLMSFEDMFVLQAKLFDRIP